MKHGEWAWVLCGGVLEGLGTIGGRRVRCLTADLQVLFHQGYEPSPKDGHDLDVLGALGA